MKTCFKCGKAWEGSTRQPSSRDFCDQCNAYLHCCRNCRFYDTAVSKQCQIPNAEYVADKEAGNFCDDFDFITLRDGDTQDPGKDKARSALDGLFGDAPAEGSDAKLDRFKGLFGD